jgi:hypothetical protein
LNGLVAASRSTERARSLKLLGTIAPGLMAIVLAAFVGIPGLGHEWLSFMQFLALGALGSYMQLVFSAGLNPKSVVPLLDLKGILLQLVWGRIELVDPMTVAIGIGQASFLIFGYNFTTKSRVVLDGREHSTQHVREHELVVPLSDSGLTVPRAVVLTVVNGDICANNVAISNAVTLWFVTLESIDREWHMFGGRIMIHPSSWLLLLVLFTGVFGACVSALQSLAANIGERLLLESRFRFYMMWPPIGAGVALIFYLVIPDGFLAGINFNALRGNPFGLTAVATLVGMFSGKVILKLEEVFLTLFKANHA